MYTNMCLSYTKGKTHLPPCKHIIRKETLFESTNQIELIFINVLVTDMSNFTYLKLLITIEIASET